MPVARTHARTLKCTCTAVRKKKERQAVMRPFPKPCNDVELFLSLSLLISLCPSIQKQAMFPFLLFSPFPNAMIFSLSLFLKFSFNACCEVKYCLLISQGYSLCLSPAARLPGCLVACLQLCKVPSTSSLSHFLSVSHACTFSAPTSKKRLLIPSYTFSSSLGQASK